MRDPKQGGSQAPRNSRELAARNQFFTPHYVVQFLTDNTFRRIWVEMQGGQTALVERCEYLVRRPGDAAVPRAKKDPRDIRVLDPACGSGHFLILRLRPAARDLRRGMAGFRHQASGVRDITERGLSRSRRPQARRTHAHRTAQPVWRGH